MGEHKINDIRNSKSACAVSIIKRYNLAVKRSRRDHKNIAKKRDSNHTIGRKSNNTEKQLNSEWKKIKQGLKFKVSRSRPVECAINVHYSPKQKLKNEKPGKSDTQLTVEPCFYQPRLQFQMIGDHKFKSIDKYVSKKAMKEAKRNMELQRAVAKDKKLKTTVMDKQRCFTSTLKDACKSKKSRTSRFFSISKFVNLNMFQNALKQGDTLFQRSHNFKVNDDEERDSIKNVLEKDSIICIKDICITGKKLQLWKRVKRRLSSQSNPISSNFESPESDANFKKQRKSYKHKSITSSEPAKLPKATNVESKITKQKITTTTSQPNNTKHELNTEDCKCIKQTRSKLISTDQQKNIKLEGEYNNGQNAQGGDKLMTNKKAQGKYNDKQNHHNSKNIKSKVTCKCINSGSDKHFKKKQLVPNTKHMTENTKPNSYMKCKCTANHSAAEKPESKPKIYSNSDTRCKCKLTNGLNNWLFDIKRMFKTKKKCRGINEFKSPKLPKKGKQKTQRDKDKYTDERKSRRSTKLFKTSKYLTKAKSAGKAEQKELDSAKLSKNKHFLKHKDQYNDEQKLPTLAKIQSSNEFSKVKGSVQLIKREDGTQRPVIHKREKDGEKKFLSKCWGITLNTKFKNACGAEQKKIGIRIWPRSTKSDVRVNYNDKKNNIPLVSHHSNKKFISEVKCECFHLKGGVNKMQLDPKTQILYSADEGSKTIKQKTQSDEDKYHYEQKPRTSTKLLNNLKYWTKAKIAHKAEQNELDSAKLLYASKHKEQYNDEQHERISAMFQSAKKFSNEKGNVQITKIRKSTQGPVTSTEENDCEENVPRYTQSSKYETNSKGARGAEPSTFEIDKWLRSTKGAIKSKDEHGEQHIISRPINLSSTNRESKFKEAHSAEKSSSESRPRSTNFQNAERNAIESAKSVNGTKRAVKENDEDKAPGSNNFPSSERNAIESAKRVKGTKHTVKDKHDYDDEYNESRSNILPSTKRGPNLKGARSAEQNASELKRANSTKRTDKEKDEYNVSRSKNLPSTKRGTKLRRALSDEQEALESVKRAQGTKHMDKEYYDDEYNEPRSNNLPSTKHGKKFKWSHDTEQDALESGKRAKDKKHTIKDKGEYDDEYNNPRSTNFPVPRSDNWLKRKFKRKGKEQSKTATPLNGAKIRIMQDVNCTKQNAKKSILKGKHSAEQNTLESVNIKVTKKIKPRCPCTQPLESSNVCQCTQPLESSNVCQCTQPLKSNICQCTQPLKSNIICQCTQPLKSNIICQCTQRLVSGCANFLKTSKPGSRILLCKVCSEKNALIFAKLLKDLEQNKVKPNKGKETLQVSQCSGREPSSRSLPGVCFDINSKGKRGSLTCTSKWCRRKTCNNKKKIDKLEADKRKVKKKSKGQVCRKVVSSHYICVRGKKSCHTKKIKKVKVKCEKTRRKPARNYRMNIRSCYKEFLKRKRKIDRIKCSTQTYLLTMRNPPCVCLYRLCPSIYPRILSLIGISKRFFNAILFTMACVVWCPFIIAMELCRVIIPGLLCAC